MSSGNKGDLNKRVHSTRNQVQKGNASLLPETSLADQPEKAIQRLLEKQFADIQVAAAKKNQVEAESSEGPSSEASGSQGQGQEGGQGSTDLTTTTEEQVVLTSQVEEDNSLEDSNSNSEVEEEEPGEEMDSQSQNMLMVMNQCLNDMFDGRKQNSAEASEWLVRSVRGMAKRSKEDATLTEAEREFQRDLILGRMAGPALRWANQLFETSATAGWNTFKREFKAKYVDTMSKNEAFRKLGNLRRRSDQSIHEYVEYAQRLFDTIGNDLPNLMKCTAMYNGLDEYLREKLYAAQEDPVATFIKKLIEAEKVREVVQRTKEPKERDQGQNQKSKKFDKNLPSSSQPKPASGKLTDEARSRLLKEGKCFRCNEKGHLQRDCPKTAPGHHGNKQAKVKEEEKPKAKNAAIDTRDKDLPPSPIFRVSVLDLERIPRSPSATATRPFATFKVDGHEVTFLVDSGADKSCITEALADKIGTMNFQSRWSLSSATGDDLGVTGDALVLLDLGKFKKVALVTVCRKLTNCIIGIDLIREAEMDIDFKGEEIKVQKEGFFIESNLVDTVLERKRQVDADKGLEWVMDEGADSHEIIGVEQVYSVQVKRPLTLYPRREQLIARSSMDTGTLPEEFSFVSKDSRVELTLKKNGDMIKVRNLSIEPIHFRTSERFKVELGGMSSSFEVADLEVSSNSREEREALVRKKLDVNPELDEGVRTELRECFVQNNDVLWLFEDDVGRVTDVVHKIETGNAKPLRKHYMPTNQPLRMAINKELKKMERMKLIRKIDGSPCGEEIDTEDSRYLFEVTAASLDLEVLKKEQEADRFCRKIRGVLMSETLSPSQKKKQAKHYLLQNGVLMKTTLNAINEVQLVFVMPESRVRELLERYHDDIISGHQCALKTADRISKRFYVRNLERHVTRYVKGCVKCQQFKFTTYPDRSEAEGIHCAVASLRDLGH
ncbi:hypothetical protein HDE_04789 [Halotydeus destructor]|nr:hypothetical protein HDE_04789 [Halotydeus destructor]